MLDSRLVRTLSRYFVARYLGLFAAILFGAALSVASVELLLGSDELVGGSGGADPLRWVLWRIPSYYLGDLVPISAFAAAFFTIAFSVRSLEWTAAAAGGIAPGRIVGPLLGAAIALAACMGIARETLVAPAMQGLSATRREADEDWLFRAGSFWYQKGRLIFSIQRADADSRTLRGVEVFERTPQGRLRAHTRAERVTVQPDGTWILHDATVRRFDPEQPERPTRIRREASLALDVRERSALVLEQTDAAAWALPQLVSYIAAHAGDDRPGSRGVLRRLDLLVQRRLSEPVLVVVLSLLAIPLALRVRPGGSVAPAAVGALAAIGAFFLLRNLAQGLASRAIWPIPIGVWSVPLLLALVSVAALWPVLRPTRR
jgi:lipopolysaccharide export LptBFGC system permease protein LptF